MHGRCVKNTVVHTAICCCGVATSYALSLFSFQTLGDEPKMPLKEAPVARLFEPFRASWRAGAD